MANSIDFLINVHEATNEAVLKYFEDTRETVTHYTSPNGFVNIIQGKELWFGNINNVNDINEINYAFHEIIYPCIEKYKFSDDMLRDKILELTKQSKHMFSFAYNGTIRFKKVSIFVFSTSFDKDSTLLWELYCKNNESKGYALTFDKNKFTDNLCEHNIISQSNTDDNPSNVALNHLLSEGKVIYDKEKQFNIVNDYLDHLEYAIKQQSSQETIQAILDIYVQKFILMALFMKDADFEKEKEYRFAVLCADDYLDTNEKTPPYLVFGTNNGNIVSRLAIPFGDELIKSITLSPFISDIKAIETTEYFLNKNGINGINFLHNLPKMRK